MHISLVRTLLDQADCFTRVGQDVYCHQYVEHVPGPGTALDMTAVKVFDARLPDLFTAIFERMGNMHMTVLPARTIRACLDFWERGPGIVLDYDTVPRHIAAIVDVQVDRQCRAKSISAMVYQVTYLNQVTGQFVDAPASTAPTIVPCIAELEYAKKYLPDSWFDAHFPGWEARHAGAKALDLRGEELARFVLPLDSERPGEQVLIQGVSFG